jgi:DUF1016 N-terminal domain
MDKITPVHQNYHQLLSLISDTYVDGQVRAVRAVNNNLLQTYWEIGQYIIEFEQNGSTKAVYGEALLEKLSKDLTLKHGKGFNRSNLSYMRLFYKTYPICAKLSHKLNWSAYIELLKIDDPLERSFYEKQAILVKYAMHGISSQLFVSKYQLYLPDREELRSELERLLNMANNEDV